MRQDDPKGPGEPELSYEEAVEILRTLAGPGAVSAPTDRDLPVPAKAKSRAVEKGPEAARATDRSDTTERWDVTTFRTLLEVLPDAMVIVDEEGAIVLVNAQTEEMFGYGRKELLGKPVELLVPERFRAGHVDYRRAYFAEPHPRPMGAQLELYGRRKSGEEFPVEISLSPLRTEDGLLVTSTIRDITERTRLEARFRALVQGIPAVTCMASLDGGISEAYVSPQIEELLGYTQREWLEDPVLWYRRMHPDDRDRWHAEFARTCATGEPFRAVYRFLARDGRVVWVQGEARVVRDRDGRPLFLHGVAFDVTERMRTEEVHERLAAIVESSDDAIIAETLDGVIVSWNRGAERVYGYSAGEVVGRPISVLVPPGRQEEITEILRRINEGERVEQYETQRVRKDGRRIYVSLTVSPIRDAEGRITGASAIARDITGRRHAEEALQRAHDELERRVEERTRELARSNAELDQFAYVASHDLGEPLRNITGLLQRLKRKYGDRLGDGAARYIDRPIENARLMDRMVRDLYVHAKVGRDAEKTPTDCANVFAEACGNLRVAIEESGAGVTADPLPVVNGVYTELVRLLQNLIGNAIKFRGERPPEVHVGVERRGDEWLFSVRDNGIGIDPRYHQQIFDFGERLHPRSRYPGIGLGLATCLKIVEHHGGRMRVESSPGEGSTFHFTLSAAKTEGAEGPRGQGTKG